MFFISSIKMGSNIPVEEKRLQLAYGTIAAKWWGSKDKRPIILVHGWQDNAGSFDALIPLLPLQYSYLAIDLPGHGLSSHLPNGSFYHQNDMASILEEIRTHFKWKRLSIIGHSMGGVIAFMYALLFPLRADLICVLDNYRPTPCERFSVHLTMANMKKLYELNSKVNGIPSEYSYDNIRELMYKGASQSINPDKIEYLMQRGVKPTTQNSKKFQFARDIRIKYIDPYSMEHKVSLNFIKQIKAPYLFIKTGDQAYAEPPNLFEEAIECFMKHNSNFEFVRVQGTHHAHLNNPDVMAHRIGEFLVKHHINESNSLDQLHTASKL